MRDIDKILGILKRLKITLTIHEHIELLYINKDIIDIDLLFNSYDTIIDELKEEYGKGE